ncbi:zinc-binding protein [Acrasis kona]|uniref:Zinc-binding protein n=1 Tax=Acrasis kona TaxID=1008807 RepID=A0AAW2Z599_9EUKA
MFRKVIRVNQSLRPILRNMSKEGVSSSVFDTPPSDTIFAKMIRGEIKVDPVYQDDHVIVLKDINPQAPTHLLLLPKKAQIGLLRNASESDAETLGRLLTVAGNLAKEHNLEEGYRLVINQGTKSQQSVNYLHVHLLSGRQFSWPPG